MFKPSTQEGSSLNEKSSSSIHVTVLGPVRVCPVLHTNATSLPGARGNCDFVVICLQLEGKLSHETEMDYIIDIVVQSNLVSRLTET